MKGPFLASHVACTGCAACRMVCPRGAVSMAPDSEGFLRPRISPRKCIGCHRCESACPALHPGAGRQAARVVAAQAKDGELRRTSSSGGIFTLLARRTLACGGVVFGASFDPKDCLVRHVAAEDESGLARIRGSKYVQSEIGDAYRMALDALIAGRNVLFSGTPCQIAGFCNVLDAMGPRVDRTRLLLVDMACHAAPSPLAWRRYLAARMREMPRGRWFRRPRPTNANFRDKSSGWHVFSLSIETDAGAFYRKRLLEDSFMQGFLKELFSRQSCHECSFRRFRSGSDITLADYWSVQKVFPDFDDNKGTSLVLLLTESGQRAFSDIQSECILRESDFDHAILGNPVLIGSLESHPRRGEFFQCVGKEPFDRLVNRLLQVESRNPPTCEKERRR